MSARARQAAARALVATASIVLVVALVAGYVRRAAVDSDQFANRATAALRDDSVRSLVAEKITDEVVLAQQADLIAARPIIESVASAIVGSRAFTGLFRAAVGDVHRAVFDRDRDTVTLTVADVGTLLAVALQRLRPSVADDVESTGAVQLLERDIGGFSADLARVGDDITLLALLLGAGALLLAGGALAVSRDRRRTVVELGVGTAAAGVVVLVAYAVLRSLAVDQIDAPEERAAAGAVWDAFLGDLRTAAWVLAGSGAIIAAAAASLIKPADLGRPMRQAAAWVGAEPRHPALRVLRGLAFVTAGLLVIFASDAVLQLLLTLAGVYLVYEGVSAILRLVYRPPQPATELPQPVPVPERRVRRRVLGPVIAGGLVVAAIAGFVGSGGATTPAPAKGPCNGHAELCDRPLDQVVVPATHNSMSVPLPGWYSAAQDRPIADQLDEGVRGLLIDTHYADRLSNGKLRTHFGDRQELRRQAEQDGVSPDAVDAALRIRERLGFSGEGERGMYLCHTFCELGGTQLGPVLDDIRDFLVSHPGEVLVVVNQDYVSPEDFVAAVEDADLDELVYRGPTDGRWPTLREMIDSNQRAVFLAENQAGAAPWYRLAYARITQETPYSFSKVSQLTEPAQLPASCKPNRGPDAAPLFLLNHWTTTDPVPLPSHASAVNAYDALLRRGRQCQRLREHLPNLVAVNFYRRGDLMRVVDTLNRLP